MTVIVDGNPRRLSLKEILNAFIDFRRSVVERRTEYKLEKAESRAHILEGLQVALDSTDLIIKLIRDAETRDEARENLIERFSFSKKQANAILKTQLGRLTSLEREKVEEELAEKREYIEKYREILSSTLKLNEIIKGELRDIKEEYGDERRSLITEKVEEVDAEKLVPDHSLVVQVTENGYINAPKRSGYKTQNRGGKGVICMDLEEDDRITVASSGNSRNETLVFTDREKVYKIKTYKLPILRRDSRGERIAGMLDISGDEVVREVLNVKGEELRGDGFCLMGTKGGYVVKNPIDDFSSAHISGIHSLNAESGDSISAATLSHGEGEILMATREGQVIRFAEEELRSTQRPAKGVRGMSLAPGDQVVSLESISPKSWRKTRFCFS